MIISCSKKTQIDPGAGTIPNAAISMTANGSSTDVSDSAENQKEKFIENYWNGIFEKAGLPENIRDQIYSYLMQGPDFTMELYSLMDQDKYLTLLVDKQHPLGKDYQPGDLVELTDSSYRVSRTGLMLRKAAADSLQVMAAAARSDGVILEAASAFRSYDYQAEVYSRNVRELGQQAADRESAKPGYSQHQLGLVVDFYPIDDSFAQTAASLWLQKNAAQFGWSLSFPEGLEDITGYRQESWHYRYVGTEAANFINKYFNGIQQYALVFIDTWKNQQ